jgi:PEP-CTERM motif
LRASLASATSLLALLLMEGHEAKAAPIVTSTTAIGFGDVLVGQAGTPQSGLWTISGQNYHDQFSISSAATPFSGTGSSTQVGFSKTSESVSYNFSPAGRGLVSETITGQDASRTGTTASLTLTGNGVAPVESVSASNYVLVTPGGGAINLTISNTGDGNLSGLGTVSNLRGTVGSSASVFVGSGGAISLGDPSQTGASTSATFGYTYTPTISGQSATGTVVTKFANGSSDGTNKPVSITATLSGTGVAPVASIAGSASAGYVLVTSSSTATVSVSNTGNGNLSGAGTISNLRGSVGALTSVSGFATTAGASISLTDTSSANYSYTYKPTVVGSSSALVVETLSNGSANGQNLASNQTTTLTGTGVAPIASVSNSTVYGRIGAGAAAGSITVANTGNANLAGSGNAYNLNGSIGPISSGSFSGAASSISLASNATGSTSSTATSTLGYTYTPGSSRAATSTTVSIAFSNGNANGTNLSQSVAATLTGSAVGPTYASTLAGKGVDTPTSGNGTGHTAGSAGATINFGTVSYKVASTLYLDLGNVTTDANGGNANLTNLTIDAYSITGGNASDFSISSVASVITEGGMLVVPITVTSDIPYSQLNSSLTIFTDEGTGLGGYGQNFTYALTALSVPEPTSLAVLGAGLAGLAGFRRRKRAAQ